MPALKTFQVPVALLTKYFPQTQPLGHQPCSTSTDFPAQVGADPLQAWQAYHPFPGKAGVCSPAHPHFPPFINPDLGQNIKTLQGFPNGEAVSRQ